MAAFSRGCANSLQRTFFQLPPFVRIATWQLRKQCVQPLKPLRSFTRSSRAELPIKKKPLKHPPKQTKPRSRIPEPSKPTADATKKPTTTSRPPPAFLYNSILKTLASRSTPTLLYTAPSHRILITIAYGGATFCSIYAVTYFDKYYLHAPPGVPGWVPVAHGVVSVIMVAVAAMCITTPWRLIRRITAVPAVGAGGRGRDALNLRIEARRMLPFGGGRVIEVPVGEVSVQEGVASRQAELLQATRESSTAVEKENAFLRPFLALGRGFSRALYALFRECENVLAKTDFTYVAVRGKGVWKLDSRGWMLDQGQAIDRLLRVDRSVS